MQYRAPIHPDIATLLEIDGGTLMLVRQIRLFVANKPVLTAISFVLDTLFGEPGDGWKDTAADVLAVTGDHTLVSWGYAASLSGLPATPSCIAHGYPLGTEIPVTLYAKPFRVWMQHRKEDARQAGLILLVRRDRARMEVRSEYEGLVLRKTFVASLRAVDDICTGCGRTGEQQVYDR